MTKELEQLVKKEAEAYAIKHYNEHPDDTYEWAFESGCSFMHGLMESEVERLKQALANLFKQNEWGKLDDRPLGEYEKIVEDHWQQFKTDNNL